MGEVLIRYVYWKSGNVGKEEGFNSGNIFG